jgi:hypothetical protein
MRNTGERCPHRAKYGNPPAWCYIHDPDPLTAEVRRTKPTKRHEVGSAVAVERDKVRAEGTLDEIVRDTMAQAKVLAKASKDCAEDGDIEVRKRAAQLGFASSRLYAMAIAALKARSTVGDILPRKNESAPEGATAVRGQAQAVVQPPQPGSPPSELDEGLDS